MKTESNPETAVRSSAVITLAENNAPYAHSLWYEAGRHILRDKLTLLVLVVLVLLTFACFVLPPFVESALGVNSDRTDIINRYRPPGTGVNILGTDHLGRDQLVRLLYGGRVSLGVAYGASLLSITIGLVVGMVAGFYGGVVDDIVNWVNSTLSSVPTIFLLILVSVIFSPSPEVLVILLGLLGWISTSRLVRSEILSLKEREFVIAARALGASNFRLLVRHLLPNVVSLVIVTLTIDAGSLILIESGLSYLGLGIQPPTPSWGNMLTSARQYFNTGPHLVFWPGIMIAVTVLCFFVVGDGLRDALDPHISRRK